MTSNSDSLNSCSVSNTERDGNTQFQGLLLEQAVNSEFRAVLIGPVDASMFYTCL